MLGRSLWYTAVCVVVVVHSPLVYLKHGQEPWTHTHMRTQKRSFTCTFSAQTLRKLTSGCVLVVQAT